MTRLLPLLVLVAACSSPEETPTPPVYPAAHPEITLPVVDEGDPMPEGALVLRVPKRGFLPAVRMSDGTLITVKGWDHLVEVLRPEADREREEEFDRHSTLEVVLWADADASWHQVAQRMIACADPENRIRRIHVAVRDRFGEIRTLPFHLPRASNRSIHIARAFWLHVRAGHGSRSFTDRVRLENEIADFDDPFVLDAEPGAPFRGVVVVLAVAWRVKIEVIAGGVPLVADGVEAGAEWSFEWGPPGPPSPTMSKPVKQALDWLAHTQGESGAWQDVDTTGAVLLAYLGAGETHRIGAHKGVIKQGLKFLKQTLPPEEPHPLHAALALVEAYRRSGSPLFKAVAQKSVERTIATVHHPSLLLIASAREASLSVPEIVTTGRREWTPTDAPLWMDEDVRAWFRTAIAARRADTAESRAWLEKLRAILLENQAEDGSWGSVRKTAFGSLGLSICDSGTYAVGCR